MQRYVAVEDISSERSPVVMQLMYSVRSAVLSGTLSGLVPVLAIKLFSVFNVLIVRNDA